MKTYKLADFSNITSAKELVAAEVALGELPTVDEVKTLAHWTKDMLSLFDVTHEEATAKSEGEKSFDRSSALTRMAYYGAEQGWTDPQIMAVLLALDDKWGKYTERRDREHRYLLPILNRARQKHGYNPVISMDLPSLGKGLASADDSVLVYGAQDFVDADFPIDWTLDQLLAQGGMGLIVGYPGTGKTQFALQLAAHVALGYEKFLKWDNLGGRKKVLFLSLEMGKAPFHHFLTQIVESYDDRRVLNKNLLIAPLGTPIPLDTKEGQAFLNNLMDEYMPDIVVIDSLQTIVSKEMTDELAVKALFHYLSVARSKYLCSMVVIHHNRKANNDAKKKDEVVLSDVYGSTYIAGSVDFVLSLRTNSPNILTVDMLKNRLGKTMEPFEICRDKNLMFSSDLENVAELFGREDDEDDSKASQFRV